MIIYKIENQVNKMAYIGKSETTFQSRYGKNWVRAVSNDYLKKSIHKYGQDSFKVDILAEVDNSNLLCELEKHFIRLHNTVYPYGFNFSFGGEGSKHIPDTKARISKTMKEIPLHHRGKFEKGLNINCRVCKKEFYTYLSRGIPNNTTCSENCSRQIYRVKVEATHLITGEKLVFESSREAERKGFCSSHIASCIKGKRKSHKGYIWGRT